MSSKEPPEVPIVCAECDTRTRVPLDDAGERIDRHNEQLHDGDEVAQVDPEVAKHVVDMLAEDMELLD